MQTENKRSESQKGNRNAAKPMPRKMLSVRLPPDIIAALNEQPDKTAAIEKALRLFLKIK